MCKKFFLAVLCACAVIPALAQTSTTEEKVEYKVETNRFWNNCFISVGGGAQVYVGDHDTQIDFGKRIAPALDIAVGKWFTPGIGVRLMYSGLKSKGATQDVISVPAHSTGEGVPGKDGWGNYLRYSKFNIGNLHADVLFNVLNLFGGYNENRKWGLSPYVGIGWAYVPDTPSANSVTGNFGLLNTYALNRNWQLNLDLRGTFVSDGLDGEKGGRKGEGLFACTIGVTYIFR